MGVYRERFVVRIESDDKRTLGRWNVDVPLEVVATLDEAVPPMDSPELREAIRLGVRARETVMEEYAEFDLEVSGPIPGLGSTPLTGEVLVDGRVVTRLREGGFRIVPAGVLGGGGAREETGVVASLTGNVRAFAFESITLRLTGDQKAALWDVDAAGYWSGTMEISLKELVEWGNRAKRESVGP